MSFAITVTVRLKVLLPNSLISYYNNFLHSTEQAMRIIWSQSYFYALDIHSRLFTLYLLFKKLIGFKCLSFNYLLLYYDETNIKGGSEYSFISQEHL